MFNNKDKVVVEITKADALILFDWLGRYNEGRCNVPDNVERQSLCNLEATFEEILVEPFQEDYDEIIVQTKERIRESLQTEDFGADMALARANDLIKQHPQSGRRYIERSMLYESLGMNEERIADLTTAIPLLSSDPRDAALLCEAYYARGLTYQAMNNHERAISDFNKVLKLNVKYSSAFQARAYSHLQIGQLSSANEDVDRAAELSPDDPHVDELRSRIRGES